MPIDPIKDATIEIICADEGDLLLSQDVQIRSSSEKQSMTTHNNNDESSPVLGNDEFSPVFTNDECSPMFCNDEALVVVTGDEANHANQQHALPTAPHSAS